MYVCCVLNCEDRTAPRYSLPKDAFIREEWIKAIKNPEILQKNQCRYKVCRNHFEPICFSVKGRLMKNAVPTLNLPGLDSAGPSTCFRNPKTSAKISVIPEKMRAALNDTRVSILGMELDNFKVTIPTKTFIGPHKGVNVSLFGSDDCEEVMDNSEVEFEIKTKVLSIKKEVDPLCELTTEENKLAIKEEEDDSEGSVEFKIKSEELIIKNEVELTYELTTGENNELSEDQRQFVIIKSESAPPCHIIDQFPNIAIKVDTSITTTEDLQRRDEKPDVNELHVTKHKCNYCGKCFAGNQNLKRHIRIHESKKTYECQLCKKSFSTNHYYKHHMLIHEGKRAYECQQCKKSLITNSHLKQHMLIHEGKKGYECQQCKKGFVSNYCFKQHMLIHEDKKVYECQQCKKSFITNSYLKQHMLIHGGTKAYECQLCKKTFTIKSDLKRHMLSHEGKKAYECQQCKAVFTFRGHLTKHMLIHEGTKSYECQHCKKAFCFNQSLKRHMLMHESNEAYECKLCRKVFTFKFSLKKHQRLHERRKETTHLDA